MIANLSVGSTAAQADERCFGARSAASTEMGGRPAREDGHRSHAAPRHAQGHRYRRCHVVRPLWRLRRDQRTRIGATMPRPRELRLLKDVQARLRALRAGRHPTSGVELEAPRHVHPSIHARADRDRGRSRSQRRADACRSFIAAITGVEPTPQPSAASSADASASTRQRSRRVSVPAARRAALCQLLIAAASTEGAAA